MHIYVLLFFSGMASRKILKLSSYKRSSYLRIPQRISVNQDNSEDDTLTAETDDDIDIMLVNGDQDQSSPVKANSEHDSHDTPLKIINEWCDQQGHGDFVQNFYEAIRTKKLQLGNISFRLFAEYLRSIVLPIFNIVQNITFANCCSLYRAI